MRIINGKIDLSAVKECDVLLFTGNNVVSPNGELVMGSGFALDMKRWFPWLPGRLGERIKDNPEYGLLIENSPDVGKPSLIGVFQTKKNWKKKSELFLIMQAAYMLTEWANLHLDKTIYVNFPGVGKGGLSVDQVLPVLRNVPNNVSFWLAK